MTTTKMFRVAASALLLMGACAAHAGLRLECPVRWDQVSRLGDPNLDAELFGVKVRDWKPEDLDEVLRKSEACSRSGPGPESMRRAEHMDGAGRVYPAAKGIYLADRDRHLREESLRTQGAAAAQQSNLTQVKTGTDGIPSAIEIKYDAFGGQTAMRSCDSLRRGLGDANAESYRQAAAFGRLCLQAQQTDAETVTKLERQAVGLADLNKQIGGFAVQVGKSVANTAAPAAQVQELSAQRQRISAQLVALGLSREWSNNALTQASNQLDVMVKRADEQACNGTFAKSGFPAAWAAHYIVLEANSPEPFKGIVCLAGKTGAQARYLSGGLLSKEGFEVKSPKRTVQVFVETHRPAGGDSGVQVMVPVSAKIDGKSGDVTRANLRALAAELIAAMCNQ